jgi:hypothetical protein
MLWNRYVRMIVILGMVAVMCGIVSAGVGIIAETHDISGEGAPVCTAPCECISEREAAMRWGADGYDRCSKTVCGQSADAMVQYYCFHQVGGTVFASLTSCEAPCECLTESGATTKWGTNGYTQCTKTLCGQDETGGGTVPRYCFRQWGSALVIGGAATTAPAQETTQAQVQAPAQAQLTEQAPASGAAPAAPSPSYTWPAAGAVPQRIPVGIATILAAVGAALLAAAGMRMK